PSLVSLINFQLTATNTGKATINEDRAPVTALAPG
ncbi:MAG: hypothetical protein UV96_C0018G0016, partial [Parcubacteria group bacterium GW2011_GWF2_43_38]